jgi:2-keto-4-pentenoate hydratase/2-oxohepta-3-ene-1,7-dioic acid hydratase in catechol pathway
MRTVRFRDPTGAVRTGTWHEDEVGFAGRRFPVDEVTLLPPCEPTKVVCVGRNYVAHADERDAEVPDRPHLFLKGPNAVAAHGDRLVLPEGKHVEPEAEMGLVVGEQCRDVDRGDAWNVLEGVTCVNDLSNRTDQDREQNWVRGKAFDNAAPMGPVVAPTDAVPDDARLELRVGGETRQSATIDRMAFGVPELVAEITSYLTLEPGDVIATGTPAGVAPVEDGDRVEVELEGVGTLANPVERA